VGGLWVRDGETREVDDAAGSVLSERRSAVHRSLTEKCSI
jgi:hypothetical protein